MLLGCRVVRGPDWKWGDQDGGEGGVGTIVSLHKFADGRTLPPKTVLVCWDVGCQADYRTGLNGCYDLRVFDSSSAGVTFKDFTCDGCMHSGITGIRWHCTVCPNFDLCNICYMNDVDNKDHSYIRFHISNDRTNGTDVGKRSASANSKVRSKGIFPGALVKSGRDWTLDNELSTKIGKVVGLTTWERIPRSAVLVNWNNALEISHRVGYEGKMDLRLVKVANGPWYYKDHLPVVSMTTLSRLASSGGKELKEGDTVTIELDVETLKIMSQGHGGWVPGMEKAIGQIGKIVKIDEDGDVHVNYGLIQWVFHPEALSKVTDLRVGDKVRVLNNKETVMKLQEGHGGWNSVMEGTLGKVGKVVRAVGTGDKVVSIDNRVWVFNPKALILESKEEERIPIGEGIPSAGATNVKELLFNAMLEGLSAGAVESRPGIEQLLIATTVGDLENVKKILNRNKALINEKLSGNKTALHVACHQGKAEVVSYLLENGANKEIRDQEGYTPLHHAAYGDKSGLCAVLMLSANANVNATDLDRTKVTPLHLAIQRGNEAPASALIQSKHCNINCQDLLGDTPLHEAILRGYDAIVTDILKVQHSKLDPSVCNVNGFNVLHLACLKNNKHAAKLLIERFPGLVDFLKEDGFAALHITALNNHHEIARMLILSGHCSINMRNHEGMTAIALAVTRSYSEMIEVLLELGVDINVEDNEGDTPLHVAVMKHCIAYIGLDLGNMGLNIPTGDRNKIEQAIALFLVTRGANINHRNHQGKTPLDLCIDKKLEEMLRRQDSIRRNKRQSGPEAALNIPRTSVNTVPGPSRVTATPTATTSIPNPTLSPFRSSATRTVGVPSHAVSGVRPTPSASPVKMPSKTQPFPMTLPPLPAFDRRVLAEGTETATRPVDSRSMAIASGPESTTTAGADIPTALSNLTLGECNPSNAERALTESTRKDPNIDIASEIKISSNRKSPKQMESQNANIQDELCRYCAEEVAVVIFKPCNHKVVCQGCSMRAKVCLQCNTVISDKISPGEGQYMGITDVKKGYEYEIRQLKERLHQVELIAYCQICMDRESNLVFRPCGHKSCQECFLRLRHRCHICKQKIEDEFLTYQ